MIRSIRGDSTEYLTITLTSPDDITTDAVEISFDDGATWHTAEHVTGGVRILVGPTGTLTLPPGASMVLVRIHDTPEVPVIVAGDVFTS